jgi:hypothetical protein
LQSFARGDPALPRPIRELGSARIFGFNWKAPFFNPPLGRMRIPLLFLVVLTATAVAQTATRNVLLVTIDGLRWQEVFSGADETLLNASKESGGVPENVLKTLRADFWADSAGARRRRLMPFVWDTIARQGQLYGNRSLGSAASVLNAERISYPGYNELLTGRADPLITSNTPLPNRNVTVLEWLHQRPGYTGQVAACAQWGVFSAIINVGRSRLPVWVTRQHSPPGLATPRLLEIERWMDEIPPLTPDEHFDAFVYHAAIEMFDTRRPRVFLLAFGEPDSWAHSRRYDRYLYSIRRCDGFIRQLWEKLQQLPQYRDCTTLIISPDHGRGVSPADWTSHGKKVLRAEETWLMALGPDTRALGERRATPEVHQAQIAGTVAALLGEDYAAAFPDAASPVADIVRAPQP